MPEHTIDVVKNRNARKWSRREQLGRVLWSLASPFFALSPRPLWGWRRFMLRAFGAQIGREVHVYPSVRITMPWNIEIGEMAAVGDRAILYALGKIYIGERATISQYAHLCAGTHDINLPERPLLKPAVIIGHDAWIAAGAFVGPGITVGNGAVVGACSVVVKDVLPHNVVGGNPAKYLKSLEK